MKAAKTRTFRFVLARLSEASTIRGLLLLLTAAGVAVRPEVGEAIIGFGLALSGLVGVLFPDAPAE